MKVKVLQSEMLPALQISSRFVSTRAQLPILSNIKLSARGAKLVISATNLEMSFSTKIGAKIEEEGEISLPAKTITDLVQSISSDQIEFSVQDEKVTVTSSQSKTTLSGNNTAEFPEIVEEIKEEGVLDLPTSEFIASLPQVAFCSSPDDTRPALSGVLFEIDTDITIVATDGFRLSKKVMKISQKTENMRFIAPRSIVSEILKIVKDDSKKLKLHYSEENNQIIIEYDDFVITSRVVDGAYPDYEGIIPSSSKVKAEVGRSDFINALKTISVIARDAANVVEFVFDDGSIRLNAENSKSGEGETHIDAQVDGGPLKILFNYKYVAEFLSAISADNVTVELNDATAAGIFRIAGDDSYLHIIMSVKL